jgi:hypothetical protein
MYRTAPLQAIKHKIMVVLSMLHGAVFLIFNVLFLNNAALDTSSNGGYGGALYLHETRTLVQIVQFRGNTAQYGGSIMNSLSDLELLDCVFSQGETIINNDANGGGLLVDGALRDDLSDPLNDGGIIQIYNTSFEENVSLNKGGGIYICLYTGSAGGGPHNDKSIIQNSRFCSNIVTGSSSPWGAAIQYDCAGSMEISSSIFGGNNATAQPGNTLETFFPSGGSAQQLTVIDTTIPGYSTGVASPGPACASVYTGHVGPAYDYGSPGTFAIGGSTGTGGTTGDSSTDSSASQLTSSLLFLVL